MAFEGQLSIVAGSKNSCTPSNEFYIMERETIINKKSNLGKEKLTKTLNCGLVIEAYVEQYSYYRYDESGQLIESNGYYGNTPDDLIEAKINFLRDIRIEKENEIIRNEICIWIELRKYLENLKDIHGEYVNPNITSCLHRHSLKEKLNHIKSQLIESCKLEINRKIIEAFMGITMTPRPISIDLIAPKDSHSNFAKIKAIERDWTKEQAEDVYMDKYNEFITYRNNYFNLKYNHISGKLLYFGIIILTLGFGYIWYIKEKKKEIQEKENQLLVLAKLITE